MFGVDSMTLGLCYGSRNPMVWVDNIVRVTDRETLWLMLIT